MTKEANLRIQLGHCEFENSILKKKKNSKTETCFSSMPESLWIQVVEDSISEIVLGLGENVC